MGADIHGFVECRPTYRSPDCADDAVWEAAIDLDFLYGGRDYDAFGRLFGVRNSAGFRPLAASRGLPVDVSEAVKRGFAGWGSDAHSASWISWSELAQTDLTVVPLDGEWAPVWSTMRALADVHGAESVRLVVWFDN